MGRAASEIDRWFRELFAAEIRAEMARQRITGRELARRLGENPQWAAQRINGVVPLNTDDIPRFAEALGMTTKRLLEQVASAIP